MKFAFWEMRKRNGGGAKFYLGESSTLFYLASLVLYLLESLCEVNEKKKKKKGNPHLLIQQIFVEHLVGTYTLRGAYRSVVS